MVTNLPPKNVLSQDRILIHWYKPNIFRDQTGRPSDTFAPRYYDLLEPLAVNISKLYPGWRMRIYHNITEDDEVFPHMCDLYCNHPHVDTCDMRLHPTEGDLQERFPAGMMWRFLVISNSMKF